MTTLEQSQLSFLCELVQREAGIRLDGRGPSFFAARLEALVQRFALGTVDELLQRLRHGRDQALCAAVVEQMTINETSFFRDGHPFVALREVLLPALLAERAHRRSLTVWSMACSSGQELWSLAVLLRECLPDTGRWHLRLVGTDLCQAMLERARAGVYPAADLRRGLDDVRRARWFEPHGDEWRVRDELREGVEFHRINLHGAWPEFGTVDLAMLRNVMIYFADADRQRILTRLHQRLAPDGLLCLGGAETLLGCDAGYSRLALGKAAFYRRRPIVPGVS